MFSIADSKLDLHWDRVYERFPDQSILRKPTCVLLVIGGLFGGKKAEISACPADR